MRRRSDGFTLVELMVVVLIIGILVAIAVPVFRAAKTKAETNTCQANQRTWAGVVQQIKANNAEPVAASAGYKTLATGADKSVWYDVANGTYLKGIPKCPSAGGAPYWIRDAAAGAAGNGDLLACGGATAGAMASASEHPIFEVQRPHRYWRIVSKAPSWWLINQGSYFACFSNVSFYASPDGNSPNLCSGKSVTASSIFTSSPKTNWSPSQVTYANDAAGDATLYVTDWEATTGQWLAFDMGPGNATEVHAVRITLFYGYYAQSYGLQWSDTGAEDDWHTQKSFATLAPPAWAANPPWGPHDQLHTNL